MADWIKMWKSISSRKIAAALATSPPIWQADYFDRYLRSGENYSQKWNYMETPTPTPEQSPTPTPTATPAYHAQIQQPIDADE
jgi:hypothetical protein